MDYDQLAREWLHKMRLLRQARLQRSINASMHGESFVLHFITRHPGPVLPSDLSHAMGVSSAMVAATLNRLEGKGFITRQIDPFDRRRVLVEITKEGNNQAELHHQTVLAEAGKMLSLLGDDDAREYVRLTGKLADIIAGHSE